MMFNHFFVFIVIYFNMIKNIFKGFIIGVGKIIPGVSGSMLAISMGVYERALGIISNVRKCKFGDFLFLLALVVGVFLGISIFSKGVKWLLSAFYLPTMLLFIGLIIGGVPDIVKEMYLNDKRIIVKPKYIVIFILSFIFSYMITRLGSGSFDVGGAFTLENGTSALEWTRNICLFLVIGFIEAFSSIVPGISGTAIFMSLGCYELLLSFYENIFNPAYLVFGISFFAGVIIGIVILAKIITFLFSKYKCAIYWAILGFMVASILVMIKMAFGFSGASVVYAYGNVSLAEFIDFQSHYFLSLLRLMFCLFMVVIGYFVGTKINYLLESD